jgi:hypothetical protein
VADTALAHEHRTRSLLSRPWLAPALVGLLAVTGCAYLGVEDPNDPNALLPRCPTKLITGLDCPACGGLRMVRALTGGQWSAALHANLFLLLLTPVAVVVWLRWFVSGVTGGSFEPRLSKRTAYALLAVAVVWTVVRNLPVWPLHPLA